MTPLLRQFAILPIENEEMIVRDAPSWEAPISEQGLLRRELTHLLPSTVTRQYKRILAAAVALALLPGTALGALVNDVDAIAMTRPQEQIVAKDIAPASLGALLDPVDAFYGFWVNGSPALLARAIGPDFVDHTLPPGRPQGPAGPAQGSKGFLAAVPDLKLAVVQRLVVGDRIVSHLRFTGHFTGTFMGNHGAGQAVDVIATDILRVHDGRITDNWHLEDNLTFLQQIGIVAQ
jgi:predicted ester cyclase